MRNRFDAQLEQLHQKLIEMGNLCEQVISMTYKVLVDEDYEAARELIEKDSRIDLKERDIEGLCLKLLLQQQPVASDLRKVSAALKMITDMERIGDPGCGYCGNYFNIQYQSAGTGYTDRPDGRGYRTDGDRQRERLCMAGFGYGPKSDRV